MVLVVKFLILTGESISKIGFDEVAMASFTHTLTFLTRDRYRPLMPVTEVQVSCTRILQQNENGRRAS